MSNIIHVFGAHERMTVEQALAEAEKANLTDVMIVGYHEDRTLCIRSSHISRAEALFMIEAARIHCLKPLLYD